MAAKAAFPCLQDRLETLEYGSDEWAEVFWGEDGGYTCMLPDGHGGEHEWTPNGEIVIRFAGKADGA